MQCILLRLQRLHMLICCGKTLHVDGVTIIITSIPSVPSTVKIEHFECKLTTEPIFCKSPCKIMSLDGNWDHEKSIYHHLRYKLTTFYCNYYGYISRHLQHAFMMSDDEHIGNIQHYKLIMFNHIYNWCMSECIQYTLLFFNQNYNGTSYSYTLTCQDHKVLLWAFLVETVQE